MRDIQNPQNAEYQRQPHRREENQRGAGETIQ